MALPPLECFLFPARKHPNALRSGYVIQNKLRAIGIRAGLPYPLTCHILRHGFFRLLKSKGVPLQVAARLGGHENINTTAMIYGHLDEDDLQKSYDEKIGGQP